MNTKQKITLRRFIRTLESIRGRHTELVSVYIPAGYDLNKIISHLQQEQGTASNIKDKTTRTNVIDSLEKMIRHLRLFKKTPEHGLAVFAGNKAEREGQQDIGIWSIEPPEPLNTRMYRCDQTFVLDLLKGMVDVKEFYGLIVIENREASIGILKGTSVTEIAKFESMVPGKIKAGGQCLNPETLIMLDDGNIIKIKEAHNPLIIISENLNQETSEKTPVLAKWENNKELHRIITSYPKIEIEASKDHMFFVRTTNGIEEKPLSELNNGDYLIMPEKINLELQDQLIDFDYKLRTNHKLVKIPPMMTPDIARILGYYLGDGCCEFDRISFYEQRVKVAENYKELLEKVFEVGVDLRFRQSKNYFQIRVNSRIIAEFFKKFFTVKDKTRLGTIPEIVLKSSDKCLAAFIRGFFDAEGYISYGIIGAGINNEILAKQLQFSLLRLGVISSVLKYDNLRNPYSKKIRYTVEISDTESLKKYYDNMGFSSSEKNSKLLQTILNRSNKNNVRQIAVNGREVAKILRNSGYDTTRFNCTLFFVNKRQMSKEVFRKRILNQIDNSILKNRLSLFYQSNLIIAKISSIDKIGFMNTVDIETKNHNFLANGLIVHNSQQRFARLREEAAHEFYKKVAEAVNKEFLGIKDLRGILIGGPGPTKETFFDGAYLNNELKKKVIGIKDLGYTGEYGLKELVEKSKDLLAKEDITREKEIMQRFFEALSKEPDKVTYGRNEVLKALEYGAVDLLIISESLDELFIDELTELAEKSGTNVEFISTDTGEGNQLKDLGGVAALLRYPIDI